MLQLLRGNLFESSAVALVNTVNCVGVMGKGIAYQFARSYPVYAKDYARRCEAKEVRLGEVYAFHDAGRVLISFPTKGHWKARSHLADIDAGLASLRALIQRERLTSIAVPPLGCGNGGLAWADVRPLIQAHLGDLEGVTIEVYEPAGELPALTAALPKISLSHYVLVGLRVGLGAPNKLSLQKAAYFFNVFSQTSYFVFRPHKFGPYALAIDPMLIDIRDYLAATKLPVESMIEDGLRRGLSGQDSDRLARWLPTLDRVLAFCKRHLPALEALATAHAVIARGGPMPLAQIDRDFLSWSEEKRARFQEDDVHQAVRVLEDEGLVTRGLLGFEVIAPRVERQPGIVDTLPLTLRGPMVAALITEAQARGIAPEALASALIAQGLGQSRAEEPA